MQTKTTQNLSVGWRFSEEEQEAVGDVKGIKDVQGVMFLTEVNGFLSNEGEDQIPLSCSN